VIGQKSVRLGEIQGFVLIDLKDLVHDDGPVLPVFKMGRSQEGCVGDEKYFAAGLGVF